MRVRGSRRMLAGVMVVGAAAVGAPAALAQNPTAGATVYTNTGCGTCHTFAAAGSTGTVGPNLDTTNTSYNKAVTTITNGSGAMPAYGSVLSATQIKDVAAYVADSGVPSTPTTPTQTTPTQTTPTQTTPTQTTPTQTTPTQTTPAQTTPAQTTPTTTTPAPGGELPSTGFDVVPVLVLAAALFGIGLALVLWRPRRKDAHH